MTLHLTHPGELASLLKVPLREIIWTLKRAMLSTKSLLFSICGKPGKQRRVVNPQGKLRILQKRFYELVLLPTLDRSHYSHGGVPGRNILTNVRLHLAQTFLFCKMFSNFYPNIHWRRIFKLFSRLGCAPEVSWLCTRLCTYRNGLAQGLVTSPILADHLMRPIDERIASLCEKHGLFYTRFVDDIAISGPFDLERSGFPALVRQILKENGVRGKPRKGPFRKAIERHYSYQHSLSPRAPRFPTDILRGSHPAVRRCYQPQPWWGF